LPIENDKQTGLSPEDDLFLKRVQELYGTEVSGDCESHIRRNPSLDRMAVVREARSKHYASHKEEFVELVNLRCGSYPKWENIIEEE